MPLITDPHELERLIVRYGQILSAHGSFKTLEDVVESECFKQWVALLAFNRDKPDVFIQLTYEAGRLYFKTIRAGKDNSE